MRVADATDDIQAHPRSDERRRLLLSFDVRLQGALRTELHDQRPTRVLVRYAHLCRPTSGCWSHLRLLAHPPMLLPYLFHTLLSHLQTTKHRVVNRRSCSWETNVVIVSHHPIVRRLQRGRAQQQLIICEGARLSEGWLVGRPIAGSVCTALGGQPWHLQRGRTPVIPARHQTHSVDRGK